MKKTILALSLLSTTIFADMYVGTGGSIGKTKANIDNKTTSEYIGGKDYSSNESSSSLYLTVGYELDNKDRIEAKLYRGSVDYKYGKQTKDFSTNGIDVTYSFNIESLNTDKFFPYVKVGLGYQQFDANLDSYYVKKSDASIYKGSYNGTIKAVTLPLAIGSYYKLADNWEMDFGILHRAAVYQDIEFKTTGGSKVSTVETSLRSTELFFGINYKF